MPDPLSITTGVVALVGACYTVTLELRAFRDGVVAVNSTVSGMLYEVESLVRVLESMKETFEQVGKQPPATGHVGTHWKNLNQSLQDAQTTMEELRVLLQGVNKEVKILDGPRKHMRLKIATSQIEVFRKQVQAYKDALQLSLQTMILWNQVTLQESTDRLLPNLDELQRDVRRIATDLNDQIRKLASAVVDGSSQRQIEVFGNLRNCVRSSATIMSTASTILGRENVDDASSFCGSEYGDCFPSEPSESMLKWISSNVINEDDQTESQSSASIPPNPAFESQPPGKPTAAHNSESDSDSDLETELTMGLFKRGRATFHKRDYDATERLLKNCLNRINAIPATTWQRKAKGGVSKDEVTGLLCESYLRLERWDEAESLLMEKLSARQESKKGEAALNDLSTLVTVLFQKSDYIACHLYARQALKGYKRLGPQGHEGFERTLILLVEICKADGKADEEEAYAVMLSDYQERMAEASSPLLPVEPSTPNTDKTEMNPRANNVPRTSPSTPESISASLVPEGSLRRKPIGKKWNGGGKDSPSELSSQIRQSDTVVDDVDDASLIEVPAETLKDSNDAKADASDSQLGLDGAIHKGCVDQNVQAVPPEHDTSIKLLNSDSMKRENIQDSNQDLGSPIIKRSSTTPGSPSPLLNTKMHPVQATRNDVGPDRVSEQLFDFSTHDLGLRIPDNEELTALTGDQHTNDGFGVATIFTKANAHKDEANQLHGERMDNPGPDSFPDTTARLPLLKAPLGKIDGTAPPGESIFVIEGDTFTVGALSLDDIPRIVAAEQAEIKRSNPHPSTAASGAAQVASPARDQTETPPTTAPSSLLPKHSRKLVVVGDGCAGKTMLLVHQSRGRVPDDFGGGITYNWDIHVSTVEVDGRAVEVSMWDTMGQEDYDRLRPLGYPGTHVVLIMFSLVNPDSLDNIQEKWISEILHFLPGVPYILVGNYKDVVNDPKEIEDLRKIGQHPVTREEAEDVCKKIEAKRYMEISAKTGEGLKELFEYATRLSLVGKPRKRRRGLKRLFGGA